MNALRATCLILPWFACVTAPMPAQTPARPSRMLHGKVVKLREAYSDPVANANVTLEQSGKMVTSNSAGLFLMPLPAEFLAGEEIRFSIDVPGYAVFEPVEARTRIPHDLRKEIVAFGLLPKGSPKFFSHEHLTMLLKGAAEKSTEQVREQGREKAVPDLSRYLKDWAVQYGFGVEQVKAEVDHWIAEVEKKQDIYELGLAAFARKNFAEAGNLFQESAQQKERKLLEARQHENQIYEETIRDYRLAGASQYNAYDFRKAIELYEKELSLADRRRTPQLWAAVLVDCGNSRARFGERTSAEEAVTSLRKAVDAYRNALEVRTRTQLPQDWAATQNNLGIALRDLAERSEGPQAAAYLEQAVGACRNALEVYTRAQLPQDWAATQNNLGIALEDLAGQSEGPRAAAYLEQAAGAYRHALEVRTREQSPRAWAGTQNNLGTALVALAARSEGPQTAAYLEQAVGAYRSALAVFADGQLPEERSGTQNNLGIAFRDLGERSEGPQAAAYLEQAVGAFQNALEVQTREQLPQDRAATQYNLGTALWDLAGRSDAPRAAAYLEQALGAFRNALEVRTREHLPKAWATTQSHLGVALWALAGRHEGPQAATYLEQAVSAFRNALEVYTRAQLPQDWAMAQNNQGLALGDLARRSQGPQAEAYLEQAVGAYRNALEVYTREQLPQNWAAAQNNLGLALRDLARRGQGPQAAVYLQQAVGAFRRALEVYTRAQLPQGWATAQNNLGTALRDLAGPSEGRTRRHIWSRLWRRFGGLLRCVPRPAYLNHGAKQCGAWLLRTSRQKIGPTHWTPTKDWRIITPTIPTFVPKSRNSASCSERQALPLPASHNRAGEAVAENIHRGAGHVHQRVDAQQDGHAFHGQPEGGERAGQDHQGGARDSGHAFAGQHQGQHHEQLLAKRQVDARGLRYENRSQREIQRAAIQVEAVARGNHERHDMFRHAELLHVLQRQRQRGFAGGGGEGDQERLPHGAVESAHGNAHQQDYGAEHQHHEQH